MATDLISWIDSFLEIACFFKNEKLIVLFSLKSATRPLRVLNESFFGAEIHSGTYCRILHGDRSDDLILATLNLSPGTGSPLISGEYSKILPEMFLDIAGGRPGRRRASAIFHGTQETANRIKSSRKVQMHSPLRSPHRPRSISSEPARGSHTHFPEKYYERRDSVHYQEFAFLGSNITNNECIHVTPTYIIK